MKTIDLLPADLPAAYEAEPMIVTRRMLANPVPRPDGTCETIEIFSAQCRCGYALTSRFESDVLRILEAHQRECSVVYPEQTAPTPVRGLLVR